MWLVVRKKKEFNMSLMDHFFDNSTYPKLVQFTKRISAGHDVYETRVEVSEGVFKKCTEKWEQNPKFKKYFEHVNALGKALCDEINKEIIRTVYEQYDTTRKKIG